jgi:hypothetical protein
VLNSRAIKIGRCVMYWMQASQRTEYNHALEYAIAKANELRRTLIVFFGITDHFPESNKRHFILTKNTSWMEETQMDSLELHGVLANMTALGSSDMCSARLDT